MLNLNITNSCRQAMKNIILISLLAISTIVNAQIDTKSYNQNLQQKFDEYQKNNEEAFKAYKAETERVFNTFKEESEKRFNEYKRNINRAFADLLAEDWGSYETEVEQSVVNSPDETPEFVEENLVTVSTIEPIQSEQLAQPVQEDNLLAFIPDVEVIEETSRINNEFSFYGNEITIDYDKSLINRSRPGTEPVFDDLWTKMARTKFYPTVKQLLETKQDLNLNDWGYFQLVCQFSYKVTTDTNHAVVLAWFLLNQSRYKTKIAQGEERLGLLIPTNYQIYGRLYTTINDVNYYLFNSNEKTFQTYDQDFSESYLVYDLSVLHPLDFDLDIIHRKLTLDISDSTRIITADFNKNAIDFYKDYPHTKLTVYFNSVATPELYASVIPVLKNALADYTPIQQLNILQKFLQDNFPYQVDDEQFGYEKVCFPEEVFYYQYSDCEDRSMLYTWFVREILEVDVAGLAFPGHVACAVHYQENEAGNFININDEQYILCDPSYIHSPVGYIIPGYDVDASEIIAVQSPEAKLAKLDIAEFLADKGLLLADKNSSVVYYKEENIYYAFGNINNPVVFGNVDIQTDSVYKAVLIKIGAGKTVKWAKVLGDQKLNSNALNLIVDKKGDVIATTASYVPKQNGLYSGQYFISSISGQGAVQWQKKVFTDSLLQDEYDHYTVYIDQKGEVKWDEFNKATQQHASSCILEDTEGYYFSFPLQSFKQSQIENVSYASSVDADPANYLISEFNQLKSAQCERSIAGMFALVNILNTPGNFITGKQIQEAVNKANPSFGRDNKDIYNGILLIDKIKNENNKLVIYTSTGSKIRVGYVQIDNKSRMNVIRYKSGNIKMDVETGIDVIKMMAFSINYATLQQTGKVIFNVKEKDYAYDVRPEIIK